MNEIQQIETSFSKEGWIEDIFLTKHNKKS